MNDSACRMNSKVLRQSGVLFLLALTLLLESAWAQRIGPLVPDNPQQSKASSAEREEALRPPSLQLNLPPPAAIALPPLGPDDLQRLQPQQGRPPVIGVHRRLPEGALKLSFSGRGVKTTAEGAWRSTEAGRLWRLKMTSPSARALRVHFRDFAIGAGRLWLHSEDGQTVGPYSGSGRYGDGDFWSGIVFGDSLTIEYLPDSAAGEAVPFQIAEISHIWGDVLGDGAEGSARLPEAAWESANQRGAGKLLPERIELAAGAPSKKARLAKATKTIQWVERSATLEPPIRQITPGQTLSIRLGPYDSPTLVTDDTHGQLEVSEDATRVTFTLESDADLELFVRFGENPAVQDGRVVTDYRHRNRTGNERIVITPQSDPPLRAGTYFIGIGVTVTGVVVNGTLTATVESGGDTPTEPEPSVSGGTLTPGQPADFRLGPVDSPMLFTGDYSFRLEAPENATRIAFMLESVDPDVDVDLFVRFGEDNGALASDHASFGPTGNERIGITRRSDPPLRAGTYFVSILVFDEGVVAEGTLTATVETDAEDCHLDATCYPEWSSSATGVALMVIESSEGGAITCSGTLLNNRRQDLTPYFLTAAHCVQTEQEARSVTALWSYQTRTCNGDLPDLRSVPRTEGARLLSTLGGARHPDGDMTLLQLEGDMPDGAVFQAWDAAPQPVGAQVTGIHHPRSADWGFFKRISFGQVISESQHGTTDDTNFNVSWPVGQGYTEPGSSGSAVFSSSETVVGALSGGDIVGYACPAEPVVDVFTHFSAFYPHIRQFIDSTSPDIGGGGTGAALGSFDVAPNNDWPYGITFANGSLYVVDRVNHKVYAYDASGRHVPDAGFDLDSDNRHPEGITFANGRFHVVDGEDEKVYAYDASGGRVPAADFDLVSGNHSPGGITFANGRFHVVDSVDDKVYAYDASGRRVPAADFALPRFLNVPQGITFANGRFHVVDEGDGKVYALDASGRHIPAADFDLVPDNDSPHGITFANGRFYVVDTWTAGKAAKVYEYDASGGRDPDDGGGGTGTAPGSFDVAPNNDWPHGITFANGSFYVVDRVRFKVYAYDASGRHVPAADFDLDSNNGHPDGITFANGRFHVVDSVDHKVYAHDASGRRVPAADFDLAPDTRDPYGITFANDRFHVVDRYTTAEQDPKVYVYDASGRRVSAADFDLPQFNVPQGITFANGRFHVVVEDFDGKVYAFDASGRHIPAADFDLVPDNDSPRGITFAGGRFYVVDTWTAGKAAKVYEYDASGDGGGTPPTLWSRSGTGSMIIDLPTRITRIRIEGEYTGSSQNFVVWCGSPGDYGGLLVNEIIGTSWPSTLYSGVHSARRSYNNRGDPCRELSIEHSTGVRWTITEVAPASGTDAPDLVVQAPSVSDSNPDAGASFTLRATVRNQGAGSSAATTLRYYRSPDAAISTGDTQVGTDAVSALAAAGASDESISLTAPSTAGTYYYGACVDPVSGESDTGNNCSGGVRVTVGVGGGTGTAPGSFDLAPDNDAPQGITFANGRFHVVDELHDKVYAYDASGRRDRGAEFDLASANGDPTGITFANGKFYVVDWLVEKVYAYEASGRRDPAADFDLPFSFSHGITFANDRFYVVDQLLAKVYAHDASGRRDPAADFDLDSDNTDPGGITFANGRFHVVDEDDAKVYAYDASGRRSLSGR